MFKKYLLLALSLCFVISHAAKMNIKEYLGVIPGYEEDGLTGVTRCTKRAVNNGMVLGHDGGSYLFKISEGKLTFSGPNFSCMSKRNIRISKDGSRAVLYSDDRMELVDTSDFACRSVKLPEEVMDGESNIYNIEISPDGTKVVVAIEGNKRGISYLRWYIVDCDSLKFTQAKYEFAEHTRKSESIEFSPCGRYAVLESNETKHRDTFYSFLDLTTGVIKTVDNYNDNVCCYLSELVFNENGSEAVCQIRYSQDVPPTIRGFIKYNLKTMTSEVFDLRYKDACHHEARFNRSNTFCAMHTMAYFNSENKIEVFAPFKSKHEAHCKYLPMLLSKPYFMQMVSEDKVFGLGKVMDDTFPDKRRPVLFVTDLKSRKSDPTTIIKFRDDVACASEFKMSMDESIALGDAILRDGTPVIYSFDGESIEIKPMPQGLKQVEIVPFGAKRFLLYDCYISNKKNTHFYDVNFSSVEKLEVGRGMSNTFPVLSGDFSTSLYQEGNSVLWTNGVKVEKLVDLQNIVPEGKFISKSGNEFLVKDRSLQYFLHIMDSSIKVKLHPLAGYEKTEAKCLDECGGKVIGLCVNSDSQIACIWDRDGVCTPFPGDQASDVVPLHCVKGASVIVGYVGKLELLGGNEDRAVYPFIWTKEGGYQFLDIPDGFNKAYAERVVAQKIKIGRKEISLNFILGHCGKGKVLWINYAGNWKEYFLSGFKCLDVFETLDDAHLILGGSFGNDPALCIVNVRDYSKAPSIKPILLSAVLKDQKIDVPEGFVFDNVSQISDCRQKLSVNARYNNGEIAFFIVTLNDTLTADYLYGLMSDSEGMEY